MSNEAKCWLAGLLFLLAGCTSQPVPPPVTPPSSAPSSGQGNEVVLYAMHLMDIEYKFGGTNPDTGLDCSGMVSYIYRQAAGIDLPHNAREIAKLGKQVGLEDARPGDLVLFNTDGHPFSHVGIYIGEGRFIHAPKRNGNIRIDSLERGYFKARLEAVRTYFQP